MSSVLNLECGRYYYRPVTNNGAGLYGNRVYTSMRDTELRRVCRSLAVQFQTLVEIERIEQLPNGARRYWMRRGERWQHYDATQDAAVRRPWPRWTP